MMRKLALAAAAFVAALVAAELVLHAVGYEPVDVLKNERGRLQVLRPSDNEILRYELEPGTRGFVWEAAVSVNSLGFRDREYTPEKPPGVRRILALGDSVTFGIGLPVEALWPELLERIARTSEPSTEVLNLGITGYDVLQEVELLERRGLALSPDQVVLAYHVNDTGRVSPAGRLIDHIVAEPPAWRRLLLAQFVTERLDRIAVEDLEASAFREDDFLRENEGFVVPVAGDDELAASMQRLRELLAATPAGYAHRYLPWYTSAARIGRLRGSFERLARLAREHDFEVVIVLVPWLDDGPFAEAYDLVYGIAAHEARRAGFAVVDPSGTFREAGPARLRLGGKDRSHPSAAGHRILAIRAAEALGLPVPSDPAELQDR